MLSPKSLSLQSQLRLMNGISLAGMLLVIIFAVINLGHLRSEFNVYQAKQAMDKSLIAGRLGMKPETLSRSLAKLRAFGVETTGRELMIRDVGALRAHFDED